MNQNSTPEQAEVSQVLGNLSRRKRGRSVARWLITICLLLGIAGLLYWWTRAPEKTQTSYQFQEVRRGDLRVLVTATGNLQPVNQVDVGSELSGIIRNVAVDYNDQVKVGQVLARLDTAKLDAQVQQSQASLAAAKARVVQARVSVEENRRYLERLRSVAQLSSGKAVSSQDLDAASATLDRTKADQLSAEASVQQNQAALAAFQTDLGKSVIYSPINGVVLSRAVDPGQTVAASLQAPVLFTLAEDLARMELHVDVDEADVGRVQAGQSAVFQVDAFPGRSFPAHISQVRYASKTVDGVVTYETILEVDNSDLSLRPGMTATSSITVQEVQGALLVPNAALRFTPTVNQTDSGSSRSSGGSVLSRLFPRPPRRSNNQKRSNGKGSNLPQQVWILEAGAPKAVPVKIGASDGIETELLAGDLKPGQQLIIDQQSRQP